MEKTCTKLTGAARLVRVLKVEGYSAATAMCTATNTREPVSDGCIKSIWNVGGYEWETSLYPATLVFGTGYDEPRFTKDAKPKTWKEKMAWDNTKWVAVKLVYLGEPLTRNLKVSLGCRLVDPMAIREPLEEKHVSRVFQGRGECSPPVVIKLIERRDLEASRYLRGDCLALQCTITVLEELPVATFPPMEVHVKVPPSNLRQNLLELLRRGTGADVTFLVSGETFAAHKNILASRSAVFMAEFFGGMKEKCSQQVEVKDMEAAVFKAMLDFIYTDDAPEFDEEKGVVTAMAQHLLAAADRYGLDRLKLICEVKLSRGISVHTAATTLALAEQHHCSQLKAQCVKFILSTPAIRDAVLATEGYKHLAISCPSVMIDLLKSAHGTGRKI